jgi:hypothetical protein
MNWQQLRDKLYYLDGSLRDIYVPCTTRYDWILWANYVNSKYKTSFYTYETEIREEKINADQVFQIWDGRHDNLSEASIFIDNILVKNYFFTDEAIENDVTPSQINSIDDHCKLIEYMSNISKILNKKVILTPENSPEIELVEGVVTVNL